MRALRPRFDRHSTAPIPERGETERRSSFVPMFPLLGRTATPPPPAQPPSAAQAHHQPMLSPPVPPPKNSAAPLPPLPSAVAVKTHAAATAADAPSATLSADGGHVVGNGFVAATTTAVASVLHGANHVDGPSEGAAQGPTASARAERRASKSASPRKARPAGDTSGGLVAATGEAAAAADAALASPAPSGLKKKSTAPKRTKSAKHKHADANDGAQPVKASMPRREESSDSRVSDDMTLVTTMPLT